MLTIECPNCKKEFDVHCDDRKTAVGCTCDCPNPDCESLLIVLDDRVEDFHKYMHSQEPRWPADGKNCGSVNWEEVSL